MFTLGKNCLNVKSVGRASVRVHVFKPIGEFTLEKNRINVTSVVRTSVTVHVLYTIRKFTQAGIVKGEECVNGFSQDAHHVFGESVLVINYQALSVERGSFR